MTVGEFIPRAAWGARPPRSTSPLRGPEGAAIHWEGPPMGAYTPEQALALVRGIQRFHMDSRGWADIAYNLVVDRFGRIIEGRGFGVRSAAQGTNAGNAGFWAICALAGAGDPITPELVEGIRQAVRMCRARGAGATVRPHRSFHSTTCPGDTLAALAASLSGQPIAAPAPTTPEVHPVTGSPRIAIAQLADGRTIVGFADGGVWLSRGGDGSGPGSPSGAGPNEFSIAADVARMETRVVDLCAAGAGVMFLLANNLIVTRYAAHPGNPT